MAAGEMMANTMKALIVDSDSARGQMLADVLKNCGYSVTALTDVNSAQQHVARENWDVVLGHELAAKGGGIQLLKAVRIAHPDSYFILLTDSPDSAGAIQAGEMGADVFAGQHDYTSLYPKLAAAQARSKARTGSRTVVHPVQLTELQPSPSRGERGNVDMILDVSITVNAVLGNAQMQISDLLQLGPGSVIELNKRAGEPIDLYVNEKLIAVGEVVVVNETFGVRITEVMDHKQRVQALG